MSRAGVVGMVWRRMWRCDVTTVATRCWGRHSRQEATHRLLRPLQGTDWQPVGPSHPLPLPPTLARGGSLPFSKKYLLTNFYTTKSSRRYSSQAWVDPPAGAVIQVPLAQTGEGIAECELLEWFVEEGENVEEFQRLCEVQSDKATIEITSRYKGKIQQILFAPGDIVKVGETLLKIFVEENQTSVPECVGDANHIDSNECKSNGQSPWLNEEIMKGVLSTPSVRHLVKEYGLDINDIKGTGRNGRVLKEDVISYTFSKGISSGSSTSLSGIMEELSQPEEEKTPYTGTMDGRCYDDKKIQLRGFHRSMVKSMTMAATVPHFHYFEEINCDALVKLKATFQDDNIDPNIKHTYLPFLIKSLSLALDRHPLLNSSFSQESNEVILKGSHNVGVAMATPFGLVVPNIKKVQSLSILQITKELSRLQQMAVNNRLNSEDISGGTITLSNIGAIGGKIGSPLLNLPEAAIVALGRIQKLPRFKEDGTLYPASIINVVVGADHRIVDGASVARFCNEWKLLIEKPELLLLHLR
uniref:Dihydrolipoamide acetyltransferase component of pyruvate dehydrogenase complex n=1 Tax=Anthurium amnicola TaxID=1678845 RepID=A0A1D1ZCA6_9ARAE